MANTITAPDQTATTWQIDPSHTLVEFAAKHMMFTTVKGRFTGVRGTIVADPQDPTRSSVDVEIDATTLVSGDERRDGHLTSADFLDVENHPMITFRSTRVEALDVAATRLRVAGDLTIRGTTRAVVLDATSEGSAKSPFGAVVAGFTAETQINRKDFGLNWNVALEAGGWLVGDTVKIVIEAQAVQQA